MKDVVHGFSILDREFFNYIIDHPLFQRLRNITQNSLANMVYPGLMHSRFEHSLGVAYSLGKAVENLANNTHKFEDTITSALKERFPSASETLMEATIAFIKELINELESKETIQSAILAGLMHDVGHLAWSHVFDYALESSWLGLERAHEQLTLLLSEALLHEEFCNKTEYNKKICTRALDLLNIAYRKEQKRNVCVAEICADGRQSNIREVANCILTKLLSSSVDIDRADYVIRDSIHSGVTFGIFDLERLYSSLVLALTVTENKNKPECIKFLIEPGILEKGVTTVENMLLGRLYMYSEVYLHDVVLAYNALAQKFITLLLNIAEDDRVCNDDDAGLTCEVINCMNIITELLREGKPVNEDHITCLGMLTDAQFKSLTWIFARERLLEKEFKAAPSLKQYFSNNVSQLAALIAVARAIAHRRHWHSFTLAGRGASKIVRKLRIDKYRDVRGRIDSYNNSAIFAALHWSGFKALGSILVVRRNDLLHPREIDEEVRALIARELKDKYYAKVFLAIFVPQELPPNIEDKLNKLEELFVNILHWREHKQKLRLSFSKLANIAATTVGIEVNSVRKQLENKLIETINKTWDVVKDLQSLYS
ncbi:hypothetical protein [Pyrodictium abyssi]|uniref:hypothetical protein n=1 Tax=Pyrodictium abyssi TaxID=54256 RepID=UPI0030C77632